MNCQHSIVHPQRHELGEGLHWDPRLGALWWVDILACELWCWSTRRGDPPRRWTLPERVGWAIPTHSGDGRLLLGLQSGVAVFDPAAAEAPPRLLWRPWDAGSPLRLNDAKADAQGRLWAGSLNNNDPSQPDGALFRIDAAAASGTQVDSGYGVANGPAIHPEGNWLLHTDSVCRTIYAFDLDPASGVLSGKRVWKQLVGDEGHPDGMNWDAEGCLWLAHWGGGCVSRYAPTGELLRRIALPTSHITNVCFGGPVLDRLFVSSARSGLSPEQLADQPLAGALFEIDTPGVQGLAGLPARG
jgi:xylono-1,5-lactonase